MSLNPTYSERLIHQPQCQWERDPETIVLNKLSDETPTFSIVIPIYNQANIIQTVLSSVVSNTVGTYEMILLVDGCTDDSKSRVIEWAGQVQMPTSFVQLHVLETPGIFETSCDNLGFVLSRGKYIIEVQADMEILTFGYNILLASPLVQYTDMIAVSGRCCHGLNSSTQAIAVGKLGEAVLTPHTVLHDFKNYGKVFLSHTVNRGPLVLRRTMLEELGYLDEKHYVLGDDEHDLFARAWIQKQWRCGFVPVEVYSPLEWGSTRKTRPPHVQTYLSERQSHQSDGFLRKNIYSISFPPSEIRDFLIQRSLF